MFLFSLIASRGASWNYHIKWNVKNYQWNCFWFEFTKKNNKNSFSMFMFVYLLCGNQQLLWFFWTKRPMFFHCLMLKGNCKKKTTTTISNRNVNNLRNTDKEKYKPQIFSSTFHLQLNCLLAMVVMVVFIFWVTVTELSHKNTCVEEQQQTNKITYVIIRLWASFRRLVSMRSPF